MPTGVPRDFLFLKGVEMIKDLIYLTNGEIINVNRIENIFIIGDDKYFVRMISGDQTGINKADHKKITIILGWVNFK